MPRLKGVSQRERAFLHEPSAGFSKDLGPSVQEPLGEAILEAQWYLDLGVLAIIMV